MLIYDKHPLASHLPLPRGWPLNGDLKEGKASPFWASHGLSKELIIKECRALQSLTVIVNYSQLSIRRTPLGLALCVRSESDVRFIDSNT